MSADAQQAHVGLTPRQRRVRKLLLFVLLVSYVNVVSLAERFVTLPVPLNPLLVVIALLLALSCYRLPVYKTYFASTWIFVLVFTVFGFMGEHLEAPYEIAQNIIKLTIAVALLPLLMAVVLDEDDLDWLTRAIYWLGVGGAVMVIAQFAFPSFFQSILITEKAKLLDIQSGRPGGPWINPNNGAMILALTLILNLPRVARGGPLMVASGAVVAGGVVFTFSRSALLALVGGVFVYTLISGSKRAALLLGTFAVIGIAVMASLYDTLEATYQSRLDSLVQIARGEEVERDTRTEFWTRSFDIVMETPLVGRGHGGMDEVLEVGRTHLGPHNFVLWVWGNSGILALLAVLWWSLDLLRLPFMARVSTERAILLAMAVVWLFTIVFSHDFVRNQYVAVPLGLYIARALAAARRTSEQSSLERQPSYERFAALG